MKECTKDKIRNPRTNRCVKKESKLGKAIIKFLKMKEETSEDKLYFYSKSKSVAPGEGANEYIKSKELYKNLEKYPDFRKVLSNFHVCPFKFEGYTYNTIEHVFQAKKIELADPEKALLFTLESNHEIGLGDGQIAQKNRKLVVLSKEVLEKWDMIKEDVMKRAAYEKYKTCKEAREILLATNNAQLWHVVMRKKPTRFVHLEEIRDEFISNIKIFK